MDGLSYMFDRFLLSLRYAELYTHFEWFMPMILYIGEQMHRLNRRQRHFAFLSHNTNTVDSNKTICYYQLS